MNITIDQIDNIEVAGVDPRDHPEYCDAYIESCDIDGREATEEEIEWIEQNHYGLASEYAFESLL